MSERKPRQRGRLQARRRGAAAVELAVIAPLLLILFQGMVEVSRGLMVQQILTNAAREGARESILEGATISDVERAVADYLDGSSISGATVAVSPNPATVEARDPVTVTVSVPHANVKWLTAGFMSDTALLSARCTMRSEGS